MLSETKLNSLSAIGKQLLQVLRNPFYKWSAISVWIYRQQDTIKRTNIQNMSFAIIQ